MSQGAVTRPFKPEIQPNGFVEMLLFSQKVESSTGSSSQAGEIGAGREAV
jgi:hypothetical protein